METSSIEVVNLSAKHKRKTKSVIPLDYLQAGKVPVSTACDEELVDLYLRFAKRAFVSNL